MIELTEEQRRCQEAILAYIDAPTKTHITMGGYAGTGKTTVIASTRQMIMGRRVAFCAFTGKAAYVLKRKLEGFMQEDDYCGTIHGLIYKRVDVVMEGHGARKRTLHHWIRNTSLSYDLIVVDEASMLNETIFQDLLIYGIPIVAVGDHGQLPPVNGKFNLMERPAIRLETIHRQVADHPIIKVATMARRYGNIPVGSHGDGVRKVLGSSCLSGMDLSSWMVLCGRNSTRIKMNDAIRRSTSRIPTVGDKVICLRNNRTEGLFNGMIGVLQELSGVEAVIEFDDFTWKGNIHLPQFGMEKTTAEYDKRMGCLFDFGYCLTVHKAQGSEAESVVLIEERFGPPDPGMYARWLYTAVTRSKRELLIIG